MYIYIYLQIKFEQPKSLKDSLPLAIRIKGGLLARMT